MLFRLTVLYFNSFFILRIYLLKETFFKLSVIQQIKGRKDVKCTLCIPSCVDSLRTLWNYLSKGRDYSGKIKKKKKKGGGRDPGNRCKPLPPHPPHTHSTLTFSSPLLHSAHLRRLLMLSQPTPRVLTCQFSWSGWPWRCARGVSSSTHGSAAQRDAEPPARSPADTAPAAGRAGP